MAFFSFRQNNSGGIFAKPAIAVVVEADSAEEANARAQYEAGIYFDGIAKGIDCDCCGDRWYRMWGDAGDERGEEESEVTQDIGSMWASVSLPSVKVYYKDGTIKEIK